MASKKVYKKKTYSKLVKKNGKVIGRIHEETSIEKAFRLLLQSCKIPFLQEFHLTPKYYDFLIIHPIDQDTIVPVLLVEIHGDYFHGREYVIEKTVGFSKLKRIQKKNVINDRRKRLLAEQKNLPLLTIWERDLRDMQSVKEALYSELIKVYGEIPQYNFQQFMTEKG
jgi:G:T-mismatch repair DNA endonuclease (very short patch repair protein)